ncbi:MAG: N-6 DNA methylase [Pirellulaceae bacterium]
MFVDNKATAFFKEVKQFRDTDVRRYHRFVWNQGIATLLVITTPTEVYVFSSQVSPVREDDNLFEDHRLVEHLSRLTNLLEVERLVYRIEAGSIYEQNPKSFDRDQAIDQHLLRNLNAAAIQLYEVNRTLSLDRIHNLLGRTIFICYLVDREIIGADFFEGAGASGVSGLLQLLEQLPTQDRINSLYRLFDLLQETFNGSLFDHDLENEKNEITDEHVQILTRFLKGDELQTGQMTLGFWAYDFNFIPIETISAIYEEFLGIEVQVTTSASTTLQRNSGAYYTPKHLAELVIDTALSRNDTLLQKKFLDPACGSGIFLVSLFNRMAEEWRVQNPNRKSNTRWRALVTLLTTRLFGIDKNETACRITCFSLYLALLDQFTPRDIRELAQQGKLLPPLLLKQNEIPTREHVRTILCRNFFENDLPDGLNDFDIIVGNPPWTGRNQSPDPKANAWYKTNVEQPLPSSQIAHAFMWKCPHHIREGGDVCLVLPSKTLLNRTDAFQHKWFSHHYAEDVLQLADLCFILFENAYCPAVIIRYGVHKERAQNYYFPYTSPQYSRNDPRRGVVVIHPEDVRTVSSTNIRSFAARNKAPIFWKVNLRGTPRDARFLHRLLDYPSLDELVGQPNSTKRWKSGQGFQPDAQGKTLLPTNRYKPQYPWWDDNHPFVKATQKINFVLTEDECQPIGRPYEQYYFVRDKRIYQAPLIIVTQGFTKIAFSDFDVLFQDSLQAISGEPNDRNNLIFLCAYLRSRLAKYFLFHTSANWGIERDKVHKYELFRLPFFLPGHEESVPQAENLVKEITAVFDHAINKIKGNNLLDRELVIKRADKEIEPLIFAYFDCDDYEQTLVCDTCEITEPSATPSSAQSNIPTLQQATRVQRESYSTMLTHILNEWGSRSPIQIYCQTIASPAAGLGIVKLEKQRRHSIANGVRPLDIASDALFSEQLVRLQKQLRKSNGMKTYMRGMVVFEEEHAFIIKPLSRRFWSRTAALNDADLLASAILNQQPDKKT